MLPTLNRGEVWLADLDPQRGTEPGKTRPVLIVQAQALLDVGHPSTLVIPLTTNLVDDAEPLRIRVPASGRLRSDSDLLIDQLRAIERMNRDTQAEFRAQRLADVSRRVREESMRVNAEFAAIEHASDPE